MNQDWVQPCHQFPWLQVLLFCGPFQLWFFWVLILHHSFSLENGVSGNIRCWELQPFSLAIFPTQIAALSPPHLKDRKLSHVGVGSHPGAGGWGSYIWESRCFVASFAKNWHSVSHIHSSPGPGLSELHKTAHLPKLSLSIPYSILSKKCWLYSLDVPLASQPHSLALTSILVWFWKLTDLLIRYPGQVWSAIPDRLQMEP